VDVSSVTREALSWDCGVEGPHVEVFDAVLAVYKVLSRTLSEYDKEASVAVLGPAAVTGEPSMVLERKYREASQMLYGERLVASALLW
jgi:hypothetical protein